MALRFRVAGFPVQVHPLFFLSTLATGSTGGWSLARLVVWFCVVFLSVLLHELGHALAYRRFGHAANISLHGLGGTATSEGGRRLTHWERIQVSLAGPCAGFLLGGLVFALYRLTPLGEAVGLARFAVGNLLWVNLGWGLINLLPVLPLDGGHVMEELIRWRSGPRYEWLIYGISLVTAAVGVVFGLVTRDVWLGTFALALGLMNAGQFAKAWVERRYAIRIRAASRRVRPAVDETAASASIEGFLAQLRSAPRASRTALPSRPPPPEPRALPARPSPPPEQRSPPARPSPPPERGSPPPRRTPPLESPLTHEQDLPELPYDPQFVGELLLDNGLPELAIHPLRSAFNEEPSAHTGHSLIAALLAAGRHADVAGWLASPNQRHLGDATLTLIATRAEAADQPALALHARELLRIRASARAPRA
jgi:stage IV sporulation protein FB